MPKTAVSAETMTPDDLPAGHRPEEFLTDEHLVGFYERQLKGLAKDAPERTELARKVRAAQRAAASTAAADREVDTE